MGEFVGQPQVLKAVNSSMIEQIIYEHGPITKPHLARLTSLSLPTVSRLVDELEACGSIRPAGVAGKGAGRKAVLYETNKDFGCLLALYYHAGTFTGRLTDITGKTLFESIFPLNHATADAAMESTVLAIEAMLERAPNEVKAIGVGVPGAVQPDGRLLGIPKIPDWTGFNLSGALSNRYPMDICVENDVKLSAVGYYRTHLNDQYDNIVYMYAGNGLGAGIILNKKLYRGSTHFSGELGFMAPLTCKPPKRDYTVDGGYLETQLGAFAAGCASREYRKATPSQREALSNILAAAAANHVAVLNPDVIVFGGEAFDDALIEKIKIKMAYYSPKESIPHILHDGSETTGIEGLIQTCRGYITTHMRLVQNVGV